MEKIFKDVRYSEFEPCLLDIYSHTGTERTLVYFHGGGLEAGDKRDIIPFFTRISNEASMSIVSVNYRMYPNAKYPNYLEDCATAVAFIKNNAAKYGLGESLYIMGSSAGAYIAMMLLFKDSLLLTYGLKAGDIAGFILDSPQPTDHFNILREMGIDTRKILITEHSPLFYVEEKTYPPFLLISYSDDIFCRIEQNQMSSKMFIAFKIPHTITILDGGHCIGVMENECGVFPIIETIKKFLDDAEDNV